MSLITVYFITQCDAHHLITLAHMMEKYTSFSLKRPDLLEDLSLCPPQRTIHMVETKERVFFAGLQWFPLGGSVGGLLLNF